MGDNRREGEGSGSSLREEVEGDKKGDATDLSKGGRRSETAAGEACSCGPQQRTSLRETREKRWCRRYIGEGEREWYGGWRQSGWGNPNHGTAPRSPSAAVAVFCVTIIVHRRSHVAI